MNYEENYYLLESPYPKILMQPYFQMINQIKIKMKMKIKNRIINGINGLKNCKNFKNIQNLKKIFLNFKKQNLDKSVQTKPNWSWLRKPHIKNIKIKNLSFIILLIYINIYNIFKIIQYTRTNLVEIQKSTTIDNKKIINGLY